MSWLCATHAGRRQLQLAPWLSSRKLKVSLESEQCIGRSRREMGSVYCANRVKLTGANLPLKVMR